MYGPNTPLHTKVSVSLVPYELNVLYYFDSSLSIRNIPKRLIARCLAQVPLYGHKTTVVISLPQGVSTEMAHLLSRTERLLITVRMSEASKFRNYICLFFDANLVGARDHSFNKIGKVHVT